MLILSRAVNEAIIFQEVLDRIVLSLTRILPESVECTVERSSLSPTCQGQIYRKTTFTNAVTLQKGATVDIRPDLRVTLLDVLPESLPPKARFGLHVPRDVAVWRKEKLESEAPGSGDDW
jgi:sRNA-binding carbon storage regulator CsrA